MFSAIRRRLRISSVQGRLTFWYLCTLGASLTAFGLFVYLVRARTLYRELDVELEVRTHQLVADLRPALLELDVAHELATDSRATGAPLVVRELPNLLLFRSPSFPSLDWASERTLARAAGDGTALVTVHNRAHESVRVATLLVRRPGTEAVALQVAQSTAPVEAALGQMAGAMILAIMIVLAIANYGSRSTARRALAPVDEIVRRVRTIQSNRLGERLDVEARSEELDRLVATLNEMLDRIEASVRGARRFAADASHELQTPIAAMRSAVEACLGDNRPPADYQGLARDLLAEIERLSVLVRDLRLLALAEAGHLAETTERVDLADLAAECCEVARALAEEKQIEVETIVQDRPVVEGSPSHLRRALFNLTQNAIRYSAHGSVVSVAVERDDGHAVVAVRDRGCGIDAADLPHIFEPFYRADRARARDTGGTGLGLAIADQIVRAHRGHIDVSSSPGLGSTFAIYLPLSSLHH